MRYGTFAGNEIKIEATKIFRFIPLEELTENGYANMAKLAVIFNHEVVEMEDGTWRWKPNRLMSWLKNHGPFYLVRDLHAGVFSIEEYMKFQMQNGYSLCGYSEIFGQHEASEYNLEGAKVPPENDPGEEYTETVIDYMIRVHEGKVLKI